jgi:hypothetical protein
MYGIAGLVFQREQQYGAVLHVPSERCSRTVGPMTPNDVKTGKVLMVVYNLVSTSYVNCECSGQIVRTMKCAYASACHKCTCANPTDQCKRARESEGEGEGDEDEDEPHAKDAKQ